VSFLSAVKHPWGSWKYNKNAGNLARYDNGIVSCQNYPEGITNTEGT